jgi:hypothetical protein
VRLFKHDFDRKGNGVKWAIACALAAAADDEVIADVIELFQDPWHRENRIAFPVALKRSRVANERVVALEKEREDPEVGVEVQRVLRPSRKRR